MEISKLADEVVLLARSSDLVDIAASGEACLPVAVGDLRDIEQLVSALTRRGLSASDFDLICTADEFLIMSAAVLVDLGRTRGIGLRTATVLRDKAVQKEAVRHAMIPTARCRTVDRLSDLVNTDIEFPIVVKPHAGAASHDTCVVRDAADLAGFARSLGDRAESRPWLAEEYVDGAEYHFDGVVRAGRIEFFSVGRYFAPLVGAREGRIVGSVLFDPVVDRDIFGAARVMAEDSLAAIGLRDGVFHLESFERGGEFVFGECAGRMAGGIIPLQVYQKYGVVLDQEWARLLMGASPLHRRAPSPSSYGSIHLPARPEWSSFPGADEIALMPGVLRVLMQVQPGDEVPDSRTGINVRTGQVLLEGDSVEAVERDANEIFNWFCSRAR